MDYDRLLYKFWLEEIMQIKPEMILDSQDNVLLLGIKMLSQSKVIKS